MALPATRLTSALRRGANRALARGGLQIVPAPPSEILGGEFERLYARCAPFTMTSKERMFALHEAVAYVSSAAIPGAIVECGVWRGGSSMLACLALAERGENDREVFLYDTFTGMPEPTAKDRTPDGEDAHATWRAAQRADGVNEWCYASLDDVRANMATTGYPADRVHLVQGMVEETIPATLPRQISILRLDTDWYDSTYHELVHLYPLLSPGGVLIIDDYGHWAGARDATDRYLGEQGISLLLSRIDYTGRIAIKTVGNGQGRSADQP